MKCPLVLALIPTLAKTKNVVWRPNLGEFARWQSGGPGDTAFAGAVFRRVANQGVKGILVDLVGSWWATQAPQSYLMAQLAWNPERTVAEIMDDYYRAGFGPAAPAIQSYWTLMEEARRKVGRDAEQWPSAVTPELFQNAAAVLDQANASAGLSDAQLRAQRGDRRGHLPGLRRQTRRASRFCAAFRSRMWTHRPLCT